MFQIMGSYQGEVEEIDTAESETEALELVGEYRLAFGQGWTVWYKPEGS